MDAEMEAQMRMGAHFERLLFAEKLLEAIHEEALQTLPEHMVDCPYARLVEDALLRLKAQTNHMILYQQGFRDHIHPGSETQFMNKAGSAGPFGPPHISQP